MKMTHKSSLVSRLKTIVATLISPIIIIALRKWSNSWQIDNKQMDRVDHLLANGEGLILAFWHQKYFPLFALAEGRKALVFTSQSFRGEVITKICRHFGYEAVLVPSGKREDRFEIVRNALKSSKLGAVVVDGPLGPYHQPKSGAVKLASSLGYLIVPISMACSSKWVMKKRWDKRELPHWGSKVTLAVSDPVRIPRNLDPSDVSLWNSKLKQILEDLDQKVQLEIKQ